MFGRKKEAVPKKPSMPSSVVISPNSSDPSEDYPSEEESTEDEESDEAEQANFSDPELDDLANDIQNAPAVKAKELPKVVPKVQTKQVAKKNEFLTVQEPEPEHEVEETITPREIKDALLDHKESIVTLSKRISEIETALMNILNTLRSI